MNTSKKKLMIGSSVFGVLCAAAAIFLFMRLSARNETREPLNGELDRRGALTRTKVYPSDENVKRLADQAARLRAVLDASLGVVSNRQVNAVAGATGTRFNDLLEATRRAVWQKANRKLVAVDPRLPDTPDNKAPVNVSRVLSLDMADYDAVSPRDEHAARLTIQARTLEQVFYCLIDSGVSAIIEVSRERFDLPAAGALERFPPGGFPDPSLPPVPAGTPADPKAVLARNTYTVSFQAAEDTVWAALANLQNLPLSPVVKEVQFRNLNESLQFDDKSGAQNNPNVGEALAAMLGRSTAPSPGQPLESAAAADPSRPAPSSRARRRWRSA
jgi:hypothetical protein